MGAGKSKANELFFIHIKQQLTNLFYDELIHPSLMGAGERKANELFKR